MSPLSTAPELIFHHARIYTVDADQPWAEAVAMGNGQILAVGTDADVLALAGDGTQRLDLGGKLVLPGLCDAHIHFYNWSVGRAQVQLADTTSKAAMLARIASRSAAASATDWIIGQGWNESRWGVTDFPTRHDLDGVTGPEQPAICWRSDMHAAVVNSAALRRAGIDASTPDPAGGVIDRDGSGAPTGVLRELAIRPVAQLLPEADGAALDAILRDGMAALHRQGITALHDQRIKGDTEGPRMLASYNRLRERGALLLRVNCNIAAHDLPHLEALGLQSGFGDDTLRLGHIKVFSDGSLGSRTAWMLAPFQKVAGDEGENYGVNVTPPEQMADEFRRASELGFPISVHAIGDRAIRVCLDIFAELADRHTGATPIPHRIEHVQTLAADDVARLATLNITASVQPTHIIDDMETADLLLGERGAQTYAFGSMLKAGTLLALGSDAPIADENPFLGIHAAIYRQRPEGMAKGPWYGEQRMTLEQALYGYTLGAARAAGWESTIGSVTPGKRADLIVLDRDLFALVDAGVTGSEMADTSVEMTVFDGKIVYESELQSDKVAK